MNGLQKHMTDLWPADAVAQSNWDAMEEMLLGILEVYMQKDIWIAVSDNTKFNTCKKKWEEL